MTTIEVYQTSNGDVTKSYYVELAKLGPIGLVAMNVFRAQKCSHRAKGYRKRAWKDNAYGRKQWSIDQLCDILIEHGATVGITFGWKEDPLVVFGENPSWVFYVDLPTGQVSFHCPNRGKGPAYHSDWDGIRGASEERVIKFCDTIFQTTKP